MMKMLGIVAYSSLLISFITAVLAIMGYRWLYWISALGVYMFSIIAGFTIGQFTVGLTFVFLTLAVGSSLRMLKGKLRSTLIVGCGFVLGICMVVFVDDKWLFFPLRFIV
ncbi:hypothetical protein [Paenibacillus eucommiae]|uniref:Uncharacterized protein n=1 Tax=Paenibacillus eucommiae TaxID=1355755 RepID=A0ABS4J813_9BACL|nr:hypothetical protein [Paenibacillus eucommiae]MBP1994889.1 hypothetical protein [Paenibacillus eucommiae]